jgi:LysR family hydrogen peroxide-inducible transcriptional activator
MTNLTLRQLRYFEALARLGHFGLAAEACAISQPALSMQVKELEAALGVPLLDRGGRPLRLTPAGEALAARARDILAQVDDLPDLVRAAADRPVGRLRLGVIPTVAPYLLPRIVGALTAAHPGLDLNLRETLTPRLLAELAEGRLDAALVALPVSEPALVEVPLFSESFVLVRPPADAGKPVPGLDRLREMRLLLLEEGHCFRDQALAVCGISPRASREILDGSSLSTLVQMVASGIGVTLIPEMAVPVETRSARVAIARFPPPEPARTLGMVWRRASPLAPALSQVAEVVRRAAVGD